MKREPPVIGRGPAAVRDAYGGDMLGSLAVGDLILALLDHHWGVMLFLAERGCRGSEGETAGQRGAALQESPPIWSLRTHGSLLRRHRGNRSPREYTPLPRTRRGRLPRQPP